MTQTAQVAVLEPGTQTIDIRTLELPPVGDHDVQIDIHATGVCHSQLHQIHAERSEPILLGHEATGRVSAVGSSVRDLRVGDEVLIAFVPSPRAGDARVPGRSWVPLGDGQVARSNNVHTWATATVVDEQYVVPAPPGTPLDEASVVGCAVMTGAGAVTQAAQVVPGQTVVVWGAGGVGMAAIAAAAISGAAEVIAVDLADDKLALASRFGATRTINAATTDPVAAIRSFSPGTPGRSSEGADWVIDCIGREATIRQGLEATRRRVVPGTTGGGLVIVGLPQSEVPINAFDLVTSERTISGSLGGSLLPAEHLGEFIDWHVSGRFDLTALVTDRYELNDVNQACDDLAAGRILGRGIMLTGAP